MSSADGAIVMKAMSEHATFSAFSRRVFNPSERKDLSTGGMTGSIMQMLINGGGTVLEYAKAIDKISTCGARNPLARLLVGFARIQKATDTIGLHIGRQSLPTVLITCIEAALGTADPDAVAMQMAIVTVQELLNSASLDLATNTPTVPADLLEPHERALEIRDTFRSANIPESDRDQMSKIMNVLCAAPRPAQPPPIQGPMPIPFSGIPPAFSPSTTGAFQGPPSTAASPHPGTAGFLNFAQQGKDNWCWNHNRPGGCKRPPGTCRKQHIIMPCPAHAAGGCPLPASVCHFKH